MTKRCRFDFGVVLQENPWLNERIEKLDINDICGWIIRQYEDTLLFEYSERQERENYILLILRDKEADSFLNRFRTIAIPRKESVRNEYVKKVFNLLSNLILEVKNWDIERDLFDYINTEEWDKKKIAFIDALFESLKGIVGEKPERCDG